MQTELRRAAAELAVSGKVRWTRPENIHLTLKFLGEVEEERLGEVRRVLEGVGTRHVPFEVCPAGFGAFPSARKARVIWAGIEGGAERLQALAEDVEKSLEPLDFERERRSFRAHLTVGRARSSPVRVGGQGPFPAFSPFPARELKLMASVMGEGGVSYSTLAAYPFSEG